MLPLLFPFSPFPFETVRPPEIRPGLQHEWSLRPDVRAFTKRWGWRIRFDQRNHTPHMLFGSPIPKARMGALVSEIAALAHLPPGSLRRGERRGSGHRTSVHYDQHWRGTPIAGAGLDVFLFDGRIQGVMASLHRPRLRETARPDEFIAPFPRGEGYGYALATAVDQNDNVLWIDRNGDTLQRLSRTLDFTMEPWVRNPAGPTVTVPVAHFTVTDGTTTAISGEDGAHGIPLPADLLFDGPEVRLLDDGLVPLGIDALSATATGLDRGAATVAHHVLKGRRWLAAIDPQHPWLSLPTSAQPTFFGASCTAQFSSGFLRFGTGAANCSSPAEVADLIRHEFGHGVHLAGLLGGSLSTELTEGASDYFAATSTNDPIIAPGFFTSGFIREIDTDRFAPNDLSISPHQSGRIFGSMAWNMRTDWSSARPDGVAQVDAWVVNTLRYGPTYQDLTEAALLGDDQDGDLRNGTPHGCELLSRLQTHGLGSGAMGLVVLDHEPLVAQPSGAGEYLIRFDLRAITPACSTFAPDSARVVLFREDGSSTEIIPQRQGTHYLATLPRVPVGETVEYALRWTDVAGGNVVQVPEQGGFRFQVGDTRPLTCAFFETGLDGYTTGPGDLSGALDPTWMDEWEVGVPAGASPHPEVAYEGVNILSTAMDTPYRHNNAQHARGPLVDLAVEGGATVLRMEARRHASFEKGSFDQATVQFASTTLWSNPPDRDVFDGGWVPFEVDLRSLHGQSGHLGFTLRSDGGVAFGGWSLDQICVVVLDQPEVHYRVSDLALSAGPGGEGGGALTFTVPFIQPLERLVVIRSSVLPTGPDSGAEIAVFDQPIPGSSISLEVEGEGFFAVFASDVEGHVFSSVLLGENAVEVGPAEDDTGGHTGDTAITHDTGVSDGTGGPGRPLSPPSPPAQTGQTGLEGRTPENEDAPRHCGCRSAPATVAWLGWLPLLGWRRR